MSAADSWWPSSITIVDGPLIGPVASGPSSPRNRRTSLSAARRASHDFP